MPFRPKSGRLLRPVEPGAHRDSSWDDWGKPPSQASRCDIRIEAAAKAIAA